MAKRFTDTCKWDDPWFSELTAHQKLIWLYICDRCSHAGIFKPNLKAMILYCDLELTTTKEEILEAFENRIYIVGDEWFLPKFIKFQYPKGLGSKQPVILSVIKELTNHKHYETISDILSKHSITLKQPLANPLPKDKATLSEPLPYPSVNPCQRVKDKDTDKDKDMDKEKEKEKDTIHPSSELNSLFEAVCGTGVGNLTIWLNELKYPPNWIEKALLLTQEKQPGEPICYCAKILQNYKTKGGLPHANSPGHENKRNTKRDTTTGVVNLENVGSFRQ